MRYTQEEIDQVAELERSGEMPSLKELENIARKVEGTINNVIEQDKKTPFIALARARKAHKKGLYNRVVK